MSSQDVVSSLVQDLKKLDVEELHALLQTTENKKAAAMSPDMDEKANAEFMREITSHGVTGQFAAGTASTSLSPSTDTAPSTNNFTIQPLVMSFDLIGRGKSPVLNTLLSPNRPAECMVQVFRPASQLSGGSSDIAMWCSSMAIALSSG